MRIRWNVHYFLGLLIFRYTAICFHCLPPTVQLFTMMSGQGKTPSEKNRGNLQIN